jgi:hypothetical protein
MTGHGAKFGRKQEEAIAALLVQKNIDEAARAAGVSGWRVDRDPPHRWQSCRNERARSRKVCRFVSRRGCGLQMTKDNYSTIAQTRRAMEACGRAEEVASHDRPFWR